ncbi:unnamed protein product [Caenorhabditis nigoni]
MDYQLSNSLLATNEFHRVIYTYIPDELSKYVKFKKSDYECKLVENDGKDQLEWMLSNSDNMLRMYGSARELADNLKIYRNFPMSPRFFEYDIVEPFEVAKVYESLKGDKFMHKGDVISILKNIFTTAPNEALELLPLVFEMVSIMINSEVSSIECTEFVKFDESFFENIKKGLMNQREQVKKADKSELASFALSNDFNSYEKVYSLFKSIFPVWEDYECIESLFEGVFPKYGSFVIEMIDLYKVVSGFIKATSRAHPDVFKPYDRVKNPSSPICVRIFVDGNLELVMKSEFFKALRIAHPNETSFEYTEEDDRRIMTMEFSEVLQDYSNHIERIEFLRVPIVRAKHAAVPILMHSRYEQHCILAIDVLFELLNRLIFGYQIFQKVDKSRFHLLEEAMRQLDTIFPSHYRCPYFVEVDCSKSKFEHPPRFGIWNKFEEIPARQVRNARKDGFTVQNLKNELANLGLTEVFPDIQTYAKAVYSEVFKAKKEEFLRTCDLFDAIEKCLLISIFKRFPNLQLFMHSQNACHRLSLINCELCNLPNQATVEKAPEVEIPSPDNTQNVAKAEKASEVIKLCPNNIQETPPNEKLDEKDPCIRKTSPEDTQKTSVLAEAPGRKKTASEDIQKSSASEKAPEVKTPSPDDIQKTIPIEKVPAVDINQSKCCPKCFRTSEMCNEAKRELKSTQTKLEKYEKKAKRTEDVEKELKALKLELKRLKTFEEKAQRLDGVEKKLKERNSEQKQMRLEMKTLEGKARKEMEQKTLELKAKNKECEDLKKKLEEHKESFAVTNHYQSERIEHISSQLEIEKQTTQSLELQIHDFQKKDEFQMNQISENLRLMEGLQNEIQGLSLRNAELQKATPPITPSTSSEVESPSFYREELWKLQKIKDSFCQKKQVTVAKEMVERLKSSTNRQEIHQIADYELLQFQGKVYQYIEEVELNIQKIRDTRECSSVFPLPDYPSFSRRFLKIYWNLIDNSQEVLPESVVEEVADSECLICFFEMSSDQKTLKCEHCKKVTHQKCASKWLKIHRSCPHCRREQLDPEEFPSLS